MISSDLPALCTVRQTAKALFGDDSQSAKNRLYIWIDNGEIEARKIGNRYYIHRNHIEKYLNPVAILDE